MTSCTEDSDDVVIDENPNALNGLEVITYGYYGKDGKSSSGTNLAVFDNQSAYDNTVSNLESQVEAWDDQFLAQWGHLDEESLETKEDELNYDDEKPLTDFENQIGLNSLRKKYLAEEESWLNNEELNVLTDPDNKSE